MIKEINEMLEEIIHYNLTEEKAIELFQNIDNTYYREEKITPIKMAEIIMKVENYNHNKSVYGCSFREVIGHFTDCKDGCINCWKEYFENII